MELGQRIKSLREKRGVSQKKLAAAVNTSPSNLSRIESGNHTPNANLVAAIADYLRVSTDYLLGRTLLENEPEKEVRELLELAIEAGYTGSLKEFLLWLQETRKSPKDKRRGVEHLVPREVLKRGGLTHRDIELLVDGLGPALIKKISSLEPTEREWLLGMVTKLLEAIETKTVRLSEREAEPTTQESGPGGKRQHEGARGIDGDMMDALINGTLDEE